MDSPIGPHYWEPSDFFKFDKMREHSNESSKYGILRFSKSIFYNKNHRNLSQFFFVEKYQFSSTFFVIDIL